MHGLIYDKMKDESLNHMTFLYCSDVGLSIPGNITFHHCPSFPKQMTTAQLIPRRLETVPVETLNNFPAIVAIAPAFGKVTLELLDATC